MNAGEINAAFVANVLALLERKGIDQSELGRRMGVGRAVVSRMLTGEHGPSTATLAKVADVFGVTPCELLCPVKPKKKKK
jgi:transcriptional regulator with XRE-family HTH domain